MLRIKFVVEQCVYDKTTECKELNVLRRKLFPKKSSIEQLPPTKDALKEHIKDKFTKGLKSGIIS